MRVASGPYRQRVNDFLSTLPTFAAGLGLGFSLIIAIGAQNAFVLRQGIRLEHIAIVVAICALSDAVLILVGITGIGAVIDNFPVAIVVIRFAGAAFLIGYGILAARRVFRPEALTASPEAAPRGAMSVALTALALTWLNPHVYLDTVLLLGSVANATGANATGANATGESLRWIFGAGAVTASVIWFTVLGFGARALRPLFAKPVAWRVLDAAVAVTMIVIGITLAVTG